MKKTAMASFFAVLVLGQVSQAQLILDLPDPGAPSSGSPSGGSTVAPTAPSNGNSSNGSSSPGQLAGSTTVSSITRKTGGEDYIIVLGEPLELAGFDLRVMSNRLKIHAAKLVTEVGEFEVPALTGLDVLAVDSVTHTGSLGLAKGVAVYGLRLKLESFGGNSDLVVTAISVGDKYGAPQLNATKALDVDQNQNNVANGGTPNPPLTNPPGTNPDGSYPSITDPGFGSSSVGYAHDGKCLLDNSFCVNDRVALGSRGLGTLVTLLSNGRAVILLDYDGKQLPVNLWDLAKVINCSFNVCQNGQLIYNSSKGRRFGSAYAVLENGQVYVQDRITAQLYMIPEGNLVFSQTCYQNRVCKGMRTFYKGQRRSPVQILEVYSDGTVEFRMGNQNKRLAGYANDFWG